MAATVEPRRDITVQDIYEMIHSDMYVLSGFNGKVLARPYRASKHFETIGKRIVIDMWAELKVIKNVFGNTARPIICVYVDGSVEYEERVKKLSEEE